MAIPSPEEFAAQRRSERLCCKAATLPADVLHTLASSKHRLSWKELGMWLAKYYPQHSVHPDTLRRHFQEHVDS